MSYLIDERFTGIAQGVGVAKILGVIHNANIKIGNSLFATTISVLEVYIYIYIYMIITIV